MPKHAMSTDEVRKNYLQEYLRIGPIPLALWRAIEARHISAVEMPGPILDLGCGFGEFASVCFDAPLDAGIDIRRSDLVRAERGQTYKFVALADARRLPFTNESFGSLISVSVFEHIPNVHEVFAESYRVVKRGGVFTFTATTSDFNEFLFFNRILRTAGLSPLGRLYVAVLTRAFRHESLLKQDDWLSLLEGVGFRVEQHRITVNRQAIKTFELTLPLAIPSQIVRLSMGSRGPRPPAFLVNFWERRLAKLVEEDTEEGCNLFVVARKP